MSVADTIKIAHTARCKLQIAADRPDRNLRFILGHAFTLDNLRLRIAEIEEEADIMAEPASAEQPRRVSFSGKTKPGTAVSEGRRSPPPPPPPLEDDLEDDEEEEDMEEDDEEDEGLGLQRFGSAAAQPPRIVGEESSSSDEEDAVDPSIFTEDQLKTITGGKGNQELKNAYKHVSGCPCHGEKGPAVENFWEVPAAEGKSGPRMAVVQVAA